jgi:hypothetical protein
MKLPVKTSPDHAGLWHQVTLAMTAGDSEAGPYACERAEARAFVEWVRYNVPTHIAVYRTDRNGGVWFSRLERKP